MRIDRFEGILVLILVSCIVGVIGSVLLQRHLELPGNALAEQSKGLGKITNTTKIKNQYLVTDLRAMSNKDLAEMYFEKGWDKSGMFYVLMAILEESEKQTVILQEMQEDLRLLEEYQDSYSGGSEIRIPDLSGYGFDKDFNIYKRLYPNG